ncbi:DNA-binding protein [Candidimonas sp. SYP-B2681]|uniref:helix-turn-helix domain-containing protein n=1 Tax=Candidimonas sp. SYP-B2681 TaxID=2497686 RepID=UPI000F897C3B|nr:DNA-binding protein [Candidimonas sp. SYP-B2681]
MMSVLEVVKHLGVSRRTVYGLAAPSGPIPCYQIGRRVLFSDGDIKEYLEKCRYTKTTIYLRAPSYSAVPLKRKA